ncbi:MAG: PAS domain-containing protein [Parachlamydiaceae bacterium]|nr:PAS domain-containing protein [Parachlamydiaceae bacterium]
MLSFRKKILLSFLAVFFLQITLIFPFASHSARSMFNNVMEARTSEIIHNIETAPDEVQLIQYLKNQKAIIFFRVSVISNERKILYDSHTKSILGASFSTDYIVNHPEVEEAFDKGVGVHEEWSQILGQKLIYLAKTFDFHGKPYVVRTAFPYQNVSQLIQEFEFGFLVLVSFILLLFSIITWFIIHHLTKPIQKIVQIAKTYQENSVNSIPTIDINNYNPYDEFGKLARTLNSLSGKIQRQINTLTTERNEKEAILESLVEGVIAVDINMVVTYANHSALELLEIKYGDLVGRSLVTFKHQKCYTLLISCQKERKVLTDTLVLGTPDKKVYLDLVAAPKKENAGAILVIEDKSIHNRMLQMRKDFIANASHELKTPLTIIQGFAETLHDIPDLPREMVEEITNKIMRNSHRMSLLIKDLLTLSDTEDHSSMRLEKVDINQIIESCTNLLRDAYPDALVILDLPTDSIIFGINNLLEMTLMNLIENALKYSLAPANVKITVSKTITGITIMIADKGIGIPAADIPHIFERFYTVDKAHSRKLGGSGLGLSIVENVILKHSGKISVASEVGSGTTFTITLPYKPKKATP